MTVVFSSFEVGLKCERNAPRLCFANFMTMSNQLTAASPGALKNCIPERNAKSTWQTYDYLFSSENQPRMFSSRLPSPSVIGHPFFTDTPFARHPLSIFLAEFSATRTFLRIPGHSLSRSSVCPLTLNLNLFLFLGHFGKRGPHIPPLRRRLRACAALSVPGDPGVTAIHRVAVYGQHLPLPHCSTRRACLTPGRSYLKAV
jgi:hypothetical protein